MVSNKGNRFILVAQNAFSKWPEATAVPKCTTAVINRWIQSTIIDQFGAPKEIMTDHGSVFDSKDFEKFLKSKDIKHLTSAIHHHEANGIVERFNRTLEEMIRTNGMQTKDWDDLVDKCLNQYRTTNHKITKKSPYEVVYGLRPRLPVDDLFDLESPQSELSMEEIREQVKQALREEAQRSKRKYDDSHNVEERNLDGEKVYWRNHASNPKEGKHFAPRFLGPFHASKTDSKWNYRITDRDGNAKIVNVDQLKRCYNDHPLAGGLRGRGRPRRVDSIVFYNLNRRKGGEV
jgi:hypothetical protein